MSKSPWKISPTKLGGVSQWMIRDQDGNSIAVVRKSEHARLVAAAPDLYRALADLRVIAEDEGIVGDNTTLEAARSAIAKATGKGP